MLFSVFLIALTQCAFVPANWDYDFNAISFNLDYIETLDDEFPLAPSILTKSIKTRLLMKPAKNSKDPPGWVDSLAIDYFLRMLGEENRIFHHADPGLYPMITNSIEDAVALTQHIPKAQILHAPIHLGNHWTLAVFKPKEKKIYYYDSFHGGDETIFGSLLAFVALRWDEYDWQVERAKGHPTQTNAYDCGVHVMMTAWCLAKDKPVDFDTQRMPEYRQLIANAIINHTAGSGAV